MEWKKTEEWGNTYHECETPFMGESWLRLTSRHRRCGALALSTGQVGSFMYEAYRNDIEAGARIETFSDVSALLSLFPSDAPFISESAAGAGNLSGYVNRDGGWANASQGVILMAKKVRAMGGKIRTGKGVRRLVRENGRTVGVECHDGKILSVALVILAVGSWPASTFPELNLDAQCLATG
jgi:sarcosine oxidase / L-pipecolate oxidase